MIAKALRGAKIRVVYTDEITAVPTKYRPAAALGYALHPETNPETDRAKNFSKYFKSNAGKLCEFAFDHPELLEFLCEQKLIAEKFTDIYFEEAEKRGDTELKRRLTEYQCSLDKEPVKKTGRKKKEAAE